MQAVIKNALPFTNVKFVILKIIFSKKNNNKNNSVRKIYAIAGSDIEKNASVNTLW